LDTASGILFELFVLMPFLHLKTYTLQYQTWGDRHLPPILFLHGFLGDCNEFEAVCELISKKYHCVAIALPGHGQTIVQSGDEYYRMEATAQGIIEGLNALQIRPEGLVGYSMGGRLALYLALHFPDYFSKVILESASPGLKTEAERQVRQERDRHLAQQLITEDFAVFLKNWYEQPLFASLRQHPGFGELCDRRLHNDPEGVGRSLLHLGLGSQPSLWHRLQDISVPLLLLVGEQDEKFVSINRQMEAQGVTAQLKVMPNCGHNIHFENPKGYAQQISAFL
jgi:2-succinyl-6-hydroxy-2,4-cyclohexadiene-1-carboxylate synthase